MAPVYDSSVVEPRALKGQYCLYITIIIETYFICHFTEPPNPKYGEMVAVFSIMQKRLINNIVMLEYFCDIYLA